MSNLPSWAVKVQTIWFALGTLIAVLGAQGVGLPEWATGLFTEDFIHGAMAVLGSATAFVQIVRSNFKQDPAQIQTMDNSTKRNRAITYALNPFQLNAA